jgi:hypothetical protein
MSKEKSALAALNDSFKEKLQAATSGAQEKNYEGLQDEIKEIVSSYLEELKGHIPKYEKKEE